MPTLNNVQVMLISTGFPQICQPVCQTVIIPQQPIYGPFPSNANIARMPGYTMVGVYGSATQPVFVPLLQRSVMLPKPIPLAERSHSSISLGSSASSEGSLSRSSSLKRHDSTISNISAASSRSQSEADFSGSDEEENVASPNAKNGALMSFLAHSQKQVQPKVRTSPERRQEMFKSELCKAWLGGAKCKFGKKCIYAHEHKNFDFPVERFKECKKNCKTRMML